MRSIRTLPIVMLALFMATSAYAQTPRPARSKPAVTRTMKTTRTPPRQAKESERAQKLNERVQLRAQKLDAQAKIREARTHLKNLSSFVARNPEAQTVLTYMRNHELRRFTANSVVIELRPVPNYGGKSTPGLSLFLTGNGRLRLAEGNPHVFVTSIGGRPFGRVNAEMLAKAGVTFAEIRQDILSAAKTLKADGALLVSPVWVGAKEPHSRERGRW